MQFKLCLQAKVRFLWRFLFCRSSAVFVSRTHAHTVFLLYIATDNKGCIKLFIVIFADVVYRAHLCNSHVSVLHLYYVCSAFILLITEEVRFYYWK